MATDKGIAKIAAQRFNINAIATRRNDCVWLRTPGTGLIGLLDPRYSLSFPQRQNLPGTGQVGSGF
jgi:hypothetical protein